MLEVNKKIRNSIANSYRLRELAKDDTLSKEKIDELYLEVEKLNKKIVFLKSLQKHLKEIENEENNKNIEGNVCNYKK
jgi:dynactin complex subunit